MIKVKAYAKFDLGIHIEPKKAADEYFPVHYIDCQIDICDKLTFKNQKDKIEIVCDDPTLPVGEENFVYKAAVLIKKISGKSNLGAKITLEKNIPVRAGFGGGSSDAAATVLGLSRLWNVGLTSAQVGLLGRELGKDFYYSYHGGLVQVFGEGKRYKIRPIKSKLPDFWLLVVVPSAQKPSTAWVYEYLDMRNVGRNSDKIKKLKAAIMKRDRMGILQNLTNDFEQSVGAKFPVVSEIKEVLFEVGAEGSIMAGAGLSVVGFFDSESKVKQAQSKFKRKVGIKKVLTAKILQ